MATEPVRDHVFFVANMQQLQTLLQRIGESSCKSKLIIKGEEGACVVSVFYVTNTIMPQPGLKETIV